MVKGLDYVKLREKRRINYLMRKLRRILKRKRKRKKSKRQTAKHTIYYGSKLLNFLNRKKFSEGNYFRANNKSFVSVKIPKIFSLIENPNETLKILKDISYQGQKPYVKEMFIDHSECEELGISASAVMDVIILEIEKHRRRAGNPINLSGKVSPKNKKVLDILLISGLLYHLNISTDKRAERNEGVIKFDRIIGNNTLEKSGEVATQITEYFNRCLNTKNLKLSREGKRSFGGMIGEVIDNCQLHGGKDAQWFILAHYLYNDEEYGECRITIFNFGNTIYESLSLIPVSSKLYKSIIELTRKHVSLFNNKWTKESLWTLYALQEGVSSLVEDGKPHGFGTITLIKSFKEIGKTHYGGVPIMSITSGDAHIIFDDKYQVETKVVEGESKKIIAFNDENTLTKSPDPDNVKILKYGFPGTIISMKFYIDEQYIKERLGGKKSDA